MVEVAGIPIWDRAREALLGGGCDRVVVVGPVPGGIPGGDRRRDSVAIGLEEAPPDTTHALVHDAARPLATATLTAAVIARLAVGDAAGVVPAVPVRDTIKRVSGDRVVETIERTDLVVVQTPQGFEIEALRAAHAADDEDASDDAQLVERSGGEIVVIAGEAANLKITYPGDLAVAEALAR